MFAAWDGIKVNARLVRHPTAYRPGLGPLGEGRPAMHTTGIQRSHMSLERREHVQSPLVGIGLGQRQVPSVEGRILNPWLSTFE